MEVRIQSGHSLSVSIGRKPIRREGGRDYRYNRGSEKWYRAKPDEIMAAGDAQTTSFLGCGPEGRNGRYLSGAGVLRNQRSLWAGRWRRQRTRFRRAASYRRHLKGAWAGDMLSGRYHFE